MKIIIPLSGKGQRFINKGYSQPKPLIEIEGKPIIEHVTNMFPEEKDIIFICNKEHLKKTNLKKTLQTIAPTAKIIGITHEEKKGKINKGPVSAIRKIKEHIQDEEEVLISYCDFFVNWDYKQFKKEIEEEKPEGAVICYTGFHPHLLNNQLYGGVLVDHNKNIIEVKEKYRYTESPFDTWHGTGTYYFKKGAHIKTYFDKLEKKRELAINNEHYILTVYELMLKDDLPCKAYEVEHFFQWGTPEDLEEYKWWSELLRKTQEGLIAEETIKFKKPEGRKIFNYWRESLNKNEFHPFKKKAS